LGATEWVREEALEVAFLKDWLFAAGIRLFLKDWLFVAGIRLYRVCDILQKSVRAFEVSANDSRLTSCLCWCVTQGGAVYFLARQKDCLFMGFFLSLFLPGCSHSQDYHSQDAAHIPLAGPGDAIVRLAVVAVCLPLANGYVATFSPCILANPPIPQVLQ
jgi:hypothetical protein